MCEKKVRKPCFIASNGAVKVPAYRRDRVKGGKTYTSFVYVYNHMSGKRTRKMGIRLR